MSSTPEALPLQRLLCRPVLISTLALALAIAFAWAWLWANRSPAGEAMEAMAGMGAMPGMGGLAAPEPWSAAYLVATVLMWALMMVAMMLPSAAPMILLHARIDRGTQAQRSRDNLLLALAYLAVWTGFAALAALAQAALVDIGAVSAAGLALGNRALAAALLLAAALWQLSPAKAACLEQCQSPLHFVMRHYRPGAAGALRLGAVHGLYCLGCCWSLMLLLFVGGVMNLAWVAILAAVVFAEKVAPATWRVERWLAAALALGAVAMLIA